MIIRFRLIAEEVLPLQTISGLRFMSVTETLDKSNTDQASVEPDGPDKCCRTGGVLGGYDGLIVWSVIVSYFMLIIATFYFLSSWLKLASYLPWPYYPKMILGMTLFSTVILWAIRLGWHFCEMVVGLVSSKSDAGLDDKQSITLDEEKHAELLEVVAQVSRRMGIDPPDEVRVSYRPECCAMELRHFSLTTQRRLILLIGLPNIAVFSINELKVVISHELSHILRGDTRLEAFACRFLDTLLSCRHAFPRYTRWLDPAWWLGSLYFPLVARLMSGVQRRQELRADATSACLYGGNLGAHTVLKDWMVSNEFHVLTTTVRQVQRFGLTRDSRNVFRQFAEYWHDFSREGDDYLEQRLAEEEAAIEDDEEFDAAPPISQRMSIMRAFPDRSEEEAEDQPIRDLMPDFDMLAHRLQPYLLKEVSDDDDESDDE